MHKQEAASYLSSPVTTGSSVIKADSPLELELIEERQFVEFEVAHSAFTTVEFEFELSNYRDRRRADRTYRSTRVAARESNGLLSLQPEGRHSVTHRQTRR